jgi:transposase
MWQPYKLAVREALPQATIVVDKFHVVKMANQAAKPINWTYTVEKLEQKLGNHL